MGPTDESHLAQVCSEFNLRKRKPVNYENPWPVDILGRARPLPKGTGPRTQKRSKSAETPKLPPVPSSESKSKASVLRSVFGGAKLRLSQDGKNDEADDIDRRNDNSKSPASPSSTSDTIPEASHNEPVTCQKFGSQTKNQTGGQKKIRRNRRGLLSNDPSYMCVYQCRACRRTFSLEGYLTHAKTAHKAKSPPKDQRPKRQAAVGRRVGYRRMREVYHRCKICASVYLFTNQHGANHCRLVHNIKFKVYVRRYLDRAVVRRLPSPPGQIDVGEEVDGNGASSSCSSPASSFDAHLPSVPDSQNSGCALTAHDAEEQRLKSESSSSNAPPSLYPELKADPSPANSDSSQDYSDDENLDDPGSNLVSSAEELLELATQSASEQGALILQDVNRTDQDFPTEKVKVPSPNSASSSVSVDKTLPLIASTNPSADPAEWYDGTEFRCRKCSFVTRSAAKMETHATRVHAVPAHQFADSFSVARTFLRCDICALWVCREKYALAYHMGAVHGCTLEDYHDCFMV